MCAARGWNFYDDVESSEAAPVTSGPPTVVQHSGSGSTPQYTSAALPPTHDEDRPVQMENESAQRLRRLYARLYPYQRELFRVSALQDSLIYLQTGGGKTWVAAALISLHLAKYPTGRIFFVARTVALAAQQASVLRELVGVSVACVAGGAREFRSATAFCASAQCRVAVVVDSKFYEWLSACPELVTKPLASLVLLDEVHHAQAGFYKKICDLLHSLRDKTDVHTVNSIRQLDDELRQEYFRGVGARSAEAAVLAARLQRAAREERQQVQQQQQQQRCGQPPHPSSVSHSFYSQSSGIEEGACGFTSPRSRQQLTSPVLDLLLQCYPRDMRCPQLIGLSASPVVRFNKIESEMLELFLIVRCRLVGVVEEVADLALHRPNPAIMALSYLPHYEERVLQSALRRSLAHVFRRMVALTPDGPTRKRLDSLRLTSVASPSFAAACDQFLTDTLMTSTFTAQLRIPPGSALLGQVEDYRASQLSEVSSRTSGPDAARRGAPFSSSSWTKEEEAKMCHDYIFFGLKFLKAVSCALVKLQEESCEEMMSSFYASFSPEELKRIQVGCQPITAIVLRPVLLSVFQLLKSLRAKYQLPIKANYSADSDAAAALTLATLDQPPAPSMRSYTLAEAREAGRCALSPALKHRSTRLQVLLRLFTELAMIAVAMLHGENDVAERHLRVLVFVETREMATLLVRLLYEHSTFAYDVLRPEVLLGQKKSQSGSSGNSMTRAQQTSLLDRFRAGTTQLVFATSVAEEGIDVPACHVVLRCNRHTELRNIVQSCGRLRRRNTVFLSLSNLLNGHPRLGFIMDGIRDSDEMLRDIARRCRDDAWSLEKDELVAGSSSVLDNGGRLPATLPLNPNEAVQPTVYESRLLSLQRTILTELQRQHQSEVFCIHRRDLSGQPSSQVQVTIMMAVPAPAESPAADRTRSSGGGGGGGRATYSGGAMAASSAASRRLTLISAFASGGIIKAHQRAFIDFCHRAEELGYLRDGRVVNSCGASSASNGAGGAVAGYNHELAALRVLSSYARQQTPSLVFLGPELCLCSRKTWPPAVLTYLSGERAAEMAVYNHDYWTSRIEPQMLLREELKAAGADAPKFHIVKKKEEAHTAAKGRAEVEAESVSEVGSSSNYSRSNARTSATPYYSQDSRNWYHRLPVQSSGTYYCEDDSDADDGDAGDAERQMQLNNNNKHQGGGGAAARRTQLSTVVEERAEVEFLLPQSVVEATTTSLAYATAGERSNGFGGGASSVRTSGSDSCCNVTFRDVVERDVDKSGAVKETRKRCVRICFTGPHADKVVSLEGLRLLGIAVVYNIDEGEVMKALSTCRLVGSIE